MKSSWNPLFVALFAILTTGALAADYNDCSMLNVKKMPSNRNNFELNGACLCELRKHMNLEHHANLVYKQMASYFARVDVAKLGFAKMFSEQAKEEHGHFEKFMDYINLRGESSGLFDIAMPKKYTWDSPLDAIRDSIELEHNVTNEIARIHRVAEKTCNDVHLVNFLESEFIDEQISSIHKLMKLQTIVKSAGEGYGEYLVDRDLKEGKLSLDSL